MNLEKKSIEEDNESIIVPERKTAKNNLKNAKECFEEEDYKEIFDLIPNSLLREPFIKSEILFKKYFPGFRVMSININRITDAIIKEIENKNIKMQDFIFRNYIVEFFSREDLKITKVVEKIFKLKPNLLLEKIHESKSNHDLILKKFEEFSDNIKSEMENINNTLMKKEQEIDQIEKYHEEFKLKNQDSLEKLNNSFADLEKQKNEHKKIIEMEHFIIQNLDIKQNELNEEINKLNIEIIEYEEQKLSKKETTKLEILNLNQKYNDLESNITKVSTEYKCNLDEIEKRIDILKNIEIIISSQSDQIKTIDFIESPIVESRIKYTRYNIKSPYNSFLEKFNSPFYANEEYQIISSSEIIFLAKNIENLSELAFESFKGWKISERKNDNITAADYFGKFLLLNGLFSLGQNHINARIFLIQSIITHNRLIGKVEESLTLRDISICQYLSSFLVEHNIENIEDKLSILKESSINQLIIQRLESLMANNMLSQVIDLIEELCKDNEVELAIQIFADIFASDQILFDKIFKLISSKYSLNNLLIAKFIIAVIMRHFKDTKNIKKVNILISEILARSNDSVDKIKLFKDSIYDELLKLSFQDNLQKERIFHVFNTVFSIIMKKSIQKIQIKEGDIIIRNLTTNLPRYSNTSLVIEINNKGMKDISDCELRAKSDKEFLKHTAVKNIPLLSKNSKIEVEIPIDVSSNILKNSNAEEQYSFTINLVSDIDGKWHQLAILSNSLVRFHKEHFSIQSYYTDGSPTQTSREMIFGRDSEFFEIESSLTGVETDRTLMIYGDRGTGKTTLWKCLLEDTFRRHYSIIDIDFYIARNKKEHRIYKNLAKDICDKLGIVSDEVMNKYEWKEEALADFDEFLEEIHTKYIPFLKHNFRKILLILDEFNIATDKYLANEWQKGFLASLRHIMGSYRGWISIILCGTSEYGKVIEEYDEPLYREGYKIKIKPLTISATEQLIKMNAPGIEYTSKAISRIIDAVGTNPSYVHQFCSKLCKIISDKSRKGNKGLALCTETDVRENEQLCISSNHIHYGNLLQIKRKERLKDIDNMEVLSALSYVSANTDAFIGMETIHALYRTYNLPPPNNLKNQLDNLNENNLVTTLDEKNEIRYKVSILMLKYWINKNKAFDKIVTDRISTQDKCAELIRSDNVPDRHKSIICSFFSRRSWLSIKPEIIKSGFSEASCYILKTKTNHDEQGDPFFLKIGQYELIEKELINHDQVNRKRVKIPKIIQKSADSPMNAPCECEKQCSDKNCKTKLLAALFDFAGTYNDDNVAELAQIIQYPDYSYLDLRQDLQELFQRSFSYFYSDLEIIKKDLKSFHYYSLRQDCITEVKTKYKNILNGDYCEPSFNLEKEESDIFLTHNPIQFYSNLIKSKTNKSGNFIISNSHGDLNIKNILKDSKNVIWIIDWSHFSNKGHFANDFTRLESEIIASLDFTITDSIQFTKIITDVIEKNISLNSFNFDSDIFSPIVRKAVCAFYDIEKIYNDLIEKDNLPLNTDRISGEFYFSFFLNLLSTCSRSWISKLGGEICLYLAGLLTDKVKSYLRTTF